MTITPGPGPEPDDSAEVAEPEPPASDGPSVPDAMPAYFSDTADWRPDDN